MSAVRKALDWISDYIPLVSTFKAGFIEGKKITKKLTSGADKINKVAGGAMAQTASTSASAAGPLAAAKEHKWYHFARGSSSRSIAMAVPVLGNVLVGVADACRHLAGKLKQIELERGVVVEGFKVESDLDSVLKAEHSSRKVPITYDDAMRAQTAVEKLKKNIEQKRNEEMFVQKQRLLIFSIIVLRFSTRVRR